MLETENRIRSNKQILTKLHQENATMTKLLSDHEKMLCESEGFQQMNSDVETMREQMLDLERKLRKVQRRMKEEEKKLSTWMKRMN